MAMRLLSRGFTAGIALLSMSAVPFFAPAHAAYPGWSTHAGQTKRAYFRPVAARSAESALLRSRWRPSAGHAGSVPERRQSRGRVEVTPSRVYRQSITGASRVIERRMETDARVSMPGMYFRPDERSIATSYTGQPAHWGTDSTQRTEPQLHSRFRPTKTSRKSSYEELQARSGYQRYPVQRPLARSQGYLGTFDHYRAPGWRSW